MTTSSPAHPHTFNTLVKEQGLAKLLADTEDRIRAKPADKAARWLLFQLLCINGDWARALRQLPLAVEGVVSGKAEIARTSDGYRSLIEAELARGEVFGGMRAPEFEQAHPSEWMLALVEALALESLENQPEADARREVALSAAPSVSGQCAQGAFEWLADADSRLGPVLELMVDGRYVWLGLDEVASFFVAPPSSPIELVWAAATVTLTNGKQLLGHMPARYPLTETGSDALRLGHETLWHEHSPTCTQGRGRKMWMSDANEWGIFDLGEVTL